MGNCPLSLYNGPKKDLRKKIKKVSFKRDSQGFLTVKYLPNGVPTYSNKAVSVRPVVRQPPVVQPSMPPKRYKKGKKN